MKNLFSSKTSSGKKGISTYSSGCTHCTGGCTNSCSSATSTGFCPQAAYPTYRD